MKGFSDSLLAGVFVLESSRVRDIASGRTEGTVTSAVLNSLDIDHIFSQVESKAELAHAGKKFQNSGDSKNPRFGVLVISAHGSEDGIELTDGSFIGWNELFSYFGEDISDIHVIFSSCYIMKDEKLVKFLEDNDWAPRHVVGYQSPVDWGRSALATALLIQSMTDESLTNWWNVLVYISQVLQLDVVASLIHEGVAGALYGKVMRFAHFNDLVDRELLQPELLPENMLRFGTVMDISAETEIMDDFVADWLEERRQQKTDRASQASSDQ